MLQGVRTTGGPRGADGGAATFNQYVAFGEVTGPSSYSTGGFTLDLSATYSTLNSLDLAVKTVGANLPVAHYEISLSGAVATIKVMRHRYDRVTTVGNITNQPAGVTVQAASGAASAAEAAHTHATDHDHGSFTSGVNQNNGGGQTLLDAVGPDLAAHTHTLDIPAFTGTSGAGSSHTHVDNSLYQHQHAITHAAENLASVELANATNLSGTVWYWAASGVRV